MEEIPDFLLETFATFDIYKYFYSLVGMNSVLIGNVGVGIYSTLSKLNHSCEPNCNVIFVNSESILETERDIEKGEQLTISYVDDKLVREERRK